MVSFLCVLKIIFKFKGGAELLHQPIYPHPYLESVDVNQFITFSAVINPKDAIKYYSVQLYNDSSTCLYDTGWIEGNLKGTKDGTIASCVFPDDFKSKTESNEKLLNGQTYYWIMMFSNDANKIEVKSPQFHFTTKNKPVINLDVDPIITEANHTFIASFYQEQGEQYMFYKYSLYKDNVLITETDEKMDSTLSFEYKSFTPGSYRIDLLVVTTERQEYSLSRFFEVRYDIQTSVLFPIATPIYNKNCINVDFSQNIFIKGVTDASISYPTYKNTKTGEEVICATIPSNSLISYSEINEIKPFHIGDEFTILYHAHFKEFFEGDIIKLYNEESKNSYVVRYDGKKFYYKINSSPEVAIDPYVNKNNIHQETSVVHESGTTIDNLDYDTLYMLYGSDEIQDNSVIMYNDITANFWWLFVLLPDKVYIYKNENYSKSVVN